MKALKLFTIVICFLTLGTEIPGQISM